MEKLLPKTVLLTSPSYRCGSGAFANALIELDIELENYFGPKHKECKVYMGGTWGHLSLPAVGRRKIFNFDKKISFQWKHAYPTPSTCELPVICVVRNINDSLFSTFKSRNDNNEFDYYLRRPNRNPHSGLSDFLKILPPVEDIFIFIYLWLQMGKNVHWVRFEDYKANPMKCLKEILNYLNLSRSESQISFAIEQSSPEIARNHELKMVKHFRLNSPYYFGNVEPEKQKSQSASSAQSLSEEISGYINRLLGYTTKESAIKGPISTELPIRSEINLKIEGICDSDGSLETKVGLIHKMISSINTPLNKNELFAIGKILWICKIAAELSIDSNLESEFGSSCAKHLLSARNLFQSNSLNVAATAKAYLENGFKREGQALLSFELNSSFRLFPYERLELAKLSAQLNHPQNFREQSILALKEIRWSPDILFLGKVFYEYRYWDLVFLSFKTLLGLDISPILSRVRIRIWLKLLNYYLAFKNFILRVIS